MAERRGAGTPPDLWTRLSLELRRDKKKSAIMAVLVLVAAVLGGRLIVSQFGPAKASASSSAAVATAEVAAPSSDGASAGGAQHGMVAKRDEYIANIKPGITRDLFKFTPEAFALAKPQKAPAMAKKPTTRPVDKEKALKELRKQLKELAQSRARDLKLQSTIVGASPIAIINGKLVRVGRKIDGFTVVSVTSRKCEIEIEMEYTVDEKSKRKAKEKVTLALEIEGWRGKSGGGE